MELGIFCVAWAVRVEINRELRECEPISMNGMGWDGT